MPTINYLFQKSKNACQTNPEMSFSQNKQKINVNNHPEQKSNVNNQPGFGVLGNWGGLGYIGGGELINELIIEWLIKWPIQWLRQQSE